MTAWLRRIDLETFESERLELDPTVRQYHVGRTKQNTVAVERDALARLHCVLIRKGSRWLVEDRNSSSGTWVNGHRITKAPLGHGDVIDLYGTLFIFLRTPEAKERALERAIDQRPDDASARAVWADWLEEHNDPLGHQLLTGIIDVRCLEGLDALTKTGRLELGWAHGLVRKATIRCTSDSTFQDVDLLGRLLSLRVCRWLRSLTVDLCTWTMPAPSRVQSDAAAVLRGLLSGTELPALQHLSFGYLSTPLPPSHFRDALLERLPTRFPRLETSPSSVLAIVRQAWLTVERSNPLIDFQFVATPSESRRISLDTGVWVGAASPGRLRALAPGVRREGLRESFLIRQEIPQWCLVPVEHGVTLNGNPAVSCRLLPGDVVEEPRGTRFRFVVR